MLFVEQPGNVLLAFPSETIYGAVDATQRGDEDRALRRDVRRHRRALARGVAAAAPGAACRASPAPRAC